MKTMNQTRNLGEAGHSRDIVRAAGSGKFNRRVGPFMNFWNLSIWEVEY